MAEGLPGKEPALAQEARAEEEAGARIDRAEPPRPRKPRPGAEPRPQQVGRQKKEAATAYRGTIPRANRRFGSSAYGRTNCCRTTRFANDCISFTNDCIFLQRNMQKLTHR